MKKLKIAFLDDQPSKLKEIELHYKYYRKKTGQEVEIDVYTDYRNFLKKFNHEVAIIDLNLDDKYDGKEVGEMLLKLHPDANLIALSSVVMPYEEPNKCIMSKFDFKFSELVSRCLFYRDNHILNTLQFLKMPSFEELAFVGRQRHSF